jgi:hypothetical protein
MPRRRVIPAVRGYAEDEAPLSAAERVLVAAILAGQGYRDAAKAIGISAATAGRWAKHPNVARAIADGLAKLEAAEREADAQWDAKLRAAVDAAPSHLKAAVAQVFPEPAEVEARRRVAEAKDRVAILRSRGA